MSEAVLKSRWLMKLDIAFEAPAVVTPNRVVINVTSGRAEGPRFNADIIAPSGDWVRLQEDGNWKIDARLAFRTDDGESVFCYYGGVVVMDYDLNARFGAGEEISGTETYLTSAPNFETGSEKYAWLNDVVAIGRASTFGGGRLVYDIYEIL
jgi:hypothetical protein